MRNDPVDMGKLIKALEVSMIHDLPITLVPREAKKLGREFGYGLAHFDGYKKYIQTFYSRVIVKNSFDSTGVAISSREWVAALNEGIEQYKQYKADAITLIDKK